MVAAHHPAIISHEPFPEDFSFSSNESNKITSESFTELFSFRLLLSDGEVDYTTG
jgi:hypothetical protein